MNNKELERWKCRTRKKGKEKKMKKKDDIPLEKPQKKVLIFSVPATKRGGGSRGPRRH